MLQHHYKILIAKNNFTIFKSLKHGKQNKTFKINYFFLNMMKNNSIKDVSGT